MKIDSEQKIMLNNGERLYLIVSGQSVDESGEPNGSHASIGAVGAFITEKRNGKTQIVASNRMIYAGSFGDGPTKWKLVKIR